MEAEAEVRVEVEVWPNSTISQDSIVGIDRTSIGRPKGEPEAGFELSFARVDLAMTLPERSAYLSTGRPEYVIDADVRKFLIELVTRRFPMDLILLSKEASSFVARSSSNFGFSANTSFPEQVK